MYRRKGGWLILGNRFIPTMRSPLLIFAGMSGIPLWKTLALAIPSGLAWNAMIVAASYELGVNADARLLVEGALARLVG